MSIFIKILKKKWYDNKNDFETMLNDLPLGSEHYTQPYLNNYKFFYQASKIVTTPFSFLILSIQYMRKIIGSIIQAFYIICEMRSASHEIFTENIAASLTHVPMVLFALTFSILSLMTQSMATISRLVFTIQKLNDKLEVDNKLHGISWAE